MSKSYSSSFRLADVKKVMEETEEKDEGETKPATTSRNSTGKYFLATKKFLTENRH